MLAMRRTGCCLHRRPGCWHPQTSDTSTQAVWAPALTERRALSSAWHALLPVELQVPAAPCAAGCNGLAVHGCLCSSSGSKGASQISSVDQQGASAGRMPVAGRGRPQAQPRGDCRCSCWPLCALGLPAACVLGTCMATAITPSRPSAGPAADGHAWRPARADCACGTPGRPALRHISAEARSSTFVSGLTARLSCGPPPQLLSKRAQERGASAGGPACDCRRRPCACKRYYAEIIGQAGAGRGKAPTLCTAAERATHLPVPYLQHYACVCGACWQGCARPGQPPGRGAAPPPPKRSMSAPRPPPMPRRAWPGPAAWPGAALLTRSGLAPA